MPLVDVDGAGPGTATYPRGGFPNRGVQMARISGSFGRIGFNAFQTDTIACLDISNTVLVPIC